MGQLEVEISLKNFNHACHPQILHRYRTYAQLAKELVNLSLLSATRNEKPEKPGMTSKQSIMHTNDDVFYPNDDSFSLTSSTASGDDSNEEGSSLRGTRTKDEKWVAGSRCLFLVVLLSAAGALSGVVYLITHEDERENFENQVS